MIKPIGNYVLVRRTKTKIKSATDLILPDSVIESEDKFKIDIEVLDIGKGELCLILPLEVGDKVVLEVGTQFAFAEKVASENNDTEIVEGLLFANYIIGIIA